MRVVAVGECCLDRYEGESEPRLGGITFNFALHAAAAFENAEVHLLSAVGEEARAVFASRLEAAGVHHDLSPATRTPSLDIRLDASGDRTFHNYDSGGLLDWELSTAQRAVIASADLVVLTRYLEIAPLFERLMLLPTRGKRVVDFADIAGMQPVEAGLATASRDRADICIFGVAPTEYALRESLHAWAGDHAGMFVITLAEGGAEAITGGMVYGQPAVPVADVVDTTGAGDCFAAHFLSVWSSTEDVEGALASACLAASQIVQKLGAY
tara:strand:+ start:130 stop:936 length:807 start_codon:yes stop_codon:yes gene_type:complete